MTEITQIQIFVSCPRDLDPEKMIVHEVSNRINKILLKNNCKIQFVIREWREVFGEIGVHPQDSINATFNEYDIYIGILWMRFGPNWRKCSTSVDHLMPNNPAPIVSGKLSN